MDIANMIEIKTLHHFPNKLQKEWDALAFNNVVNVPFLRFGYQEQWWKTRGGGEWEDGELILFLGYQEDTLIGIAPFFNTIDDGKTIFRLVGSLEISDYLDLIAAPEHYIEFFQSILSYIEHNLAWDEIVFENIPAHSPLMQYIDEHQDRENHSLKLEKSYVAPEVTLPNSWESYLANLDKKQRHEVRRKIRRVEQDDIQSRFYRIENENELDLAVYTFLDLMKQDPQKSAFLTPDMQAHMHDLMKWSYQEGILYLCFLEIDQVTAAGYFCFDDGEKIYIYNSGFNNDMRSFSPGWVLLSYLIQWAIENSRTAVDFMRGSESYKYKFGGVDKLLYHVSVSR